MVALLAAAFTALGPVQGFAAALRDSFCRAVGAECASGATAAYGPAVPLADPALTDLERTHLMAEDPQLASLELSPFTASELAWLEVNDPEAFEAALRVRSWTEQQELLDAALDAEIADFQVLKDSDEHDERMDWSDNGCSSPIGSEAPWFHFREACERHDFGYRNAKRLGLFDGYKERIDAIFAKDMADSCEEEAWWEKKQCKFTATIYFSAVKVAGGKCELPGPAGRVPGPCAPEHG